GGCGGRKALVWRERAHVRVVHARQFSRETRRVRRQDLGCDHHHQLGLLLPRSLALEEQSENWNVADAGYLLELLSHSIVHQASDRECLLVHQLDFSFSPPRAQRRNPETLQYDGIVEVEGADFGPYLQVDAFANNGRREVQADPEFLPLNGNRHVPAGALRNRHRYFPAREKACLFAALRHQARLGKALEEPLRLQEHDHRAHAFFAVVDKQVQEVAEDEPALLVAVKIGGGELLRRGATKPFLLVPIDNVAGTKLGQGAAVH